MPTSRQYDAGHVPSRVPNASERWLRRIFVEDWNLKLLSLAITLGLWFAVTGQRAPLSRQLRAVQLNFHTPEGIEVANNPIEAVTVTVKGPQSQIDGINSRDLGVNLEIPERTPGQRVVQLTPGRVQIDLPAGVQVEGIEPSSVSVKLEAIVARDVPVEAHIEGRLPDGYTLGQITITPAVVKVRGPSGHVLALPRVATETISIEGRRESFDAPETSIYIADQKVDTLETVNVHVEILRQNPKPK